jgi:hypothetical protein
MVVLAKTTRNATIGFVVLGYALYWVRRGGASAVGSKAAFLWQKFPKFVLGFLLISGLATAGVFTSLQSSESPGAVPPGLAAARRRRLRRVRNRGDDACDRHGRRTVSGLNT